MTVRPVTASNAIELLSFMAYPQPSTTREKSMALIRKWAERGDIKKLGADQFGNQTYDFVGILAKVMTKANAA